MSYTQEDLKRYAKLSSTSDEQFKFILNEKIEDCFILKISMQIESKMGVVLLLVSEFSGNILIMYSLFGNSPTIRRIQPFEKHPTLLQNMLKAFQEGATEMAISERIGRTIYRILLPEIALSYTSNLNKKDFSLIKESIIQGIIKETKLMNVQMEIDLEKINSIQFLKKNPLSGILPEVRNPFEINETTTSVQSSSTPRTQTVFPKTKVEIAIEEIKKEYKEVVKCQTVVSPVTGLSFDELKSGQKLIFLLPFKTPEERSRARRLGAINSLGQNQPIVGEFIKLIMAENEYHIFAKGPYNILLHAFEERPVRLAYPKDSGSERFEEKTIKTFLLVIGIFILFILVLFFLYFR